VGVVFAAFVLVGSFASPDHFITFEAWFFTSDLFPALLVPFTLSHPMYPQPHRPPLNHLQPTPLPHIMQHHPRRNMLRHMNSLLIPLMRGTVPRPQPFCFFTVLEDPGSKMLFGWEEGGWCVESAVDEEEGITATVHFS